jgi:hypothetical protein
VTNRPAVKEVAALLRESGVHTSFVFNKTKKYLPSWLPQVS